MIGARGRGALALAVLAAILSAQACAGEAFSLRHRDAAEQTLAYDVDVKVGKFSFDGLLGVPAGGLAGDDEWAIWAKDPVDLVLKAAMFLPGDRVAAAGGAWEHTRAPWRLKVGGDYRGELLPARGSDEEGVRRIRATWKFERPRKYVDYLIGEWPIAGELEIDSVFDSRIGVIASARVEGTVTYAELEPSRRGPKPEKVRARIEFREILDPSSGELQQAVDAAVEEAVGYLKKQKATDAFGGGARCLTALALLHAEVPASDASVARLVADAKSSELTGTYGNALGLMVIDALTEPEAERRARRKNQLVAESRREVPPELKQWGSSLLDALLSHMAADGSFDYSPAQAAASPGDYSNTQYGLLGLISARRLGLDIEAGVWTRLAKAYTSPFTSSGRTPAGGIGPGGGDEGGEGDGDGDGDRDGDGEGGEDAGGDGEGAAPATPGDVPVRAPAQPRGYTYLIGSTDRQYGSMTAAGLAALYALRAILPAESEQADDIQYGIDCCVLWLEKNWTVRGVPPLTRPHVATRSTAKDGWGALYYLYALERAGMLGGIERFGERAWYEEGAWQLVSAQEPDGSWGAGPIDTAFAILFLVRSTPPAPVTGE